MLCVISKPLENCGLIVKTNKVRKVVLISSPKRTFTTIIKKEKEVDMHFLLIDLIEYLTDSSRLS